MKKLISLAIAALTAALLLAGCGNEAKIVGEWRLTSGDFADHITLREDGTGTILSDEKTKTFTYVLTDDTLTFQYPDIGHGVGYSIKGDVLTVHDSTFERIG